MDKSTLEIPKIASAIYLIRGQRVMLDTDLARLYGVAVKRLNEQTKRNKRRFPEDFMFQLTLQDVGSLRSHFATLKKKGRGRYRKYLPYVFTEQGVAMLSGVLTSSRAIDVNIAIMRAFVRLKEILSTNKELAHKLAELEHKIERHDGDIRAIFDALRQLMAVPEKPKRQIGFHP